MDGVVWLSHVLVNLHVYIYIYVFTYIYIYIYIYICKSQTAVTYPIDLVDL